jgi:hypothetical protein
MDMSQNSKLARYFQSRQIYSQGLPPRLMGNTQQVTDILPDYRILRHLNNLAHKELWWLSGARLVSLLLLESQALLVRAQGYSLVCECKDSAHIYTRH